MIPGLAALAPAPDSLFPRFPCSPVGRAIQTGSLNPAVVANLSFRLPFFAGGTVVQDESGELKAAYASRLRGSLDRAGCPSSTADGRNARDPCVASDLGKVREDFAEEGEEGLGEDCLGTP